MYAERALTKVSRDMEKWARALFREKAEMDYYSGLATARDAARDQGLAEGRAEGKAEGLAEGMSKGLVQGSKSLFKLWIFTVNRPQKSRFSGSFGACKVEFWRLQRQNSRF
jgi:flagellar biosynthesis/type III secretory pathway protein FliH